MLNQKKDGTHVVNQKKYAAIGASKRRKLPLANDGADTARGGVLGAQKCMWCIEARTWCSCIQLQESHCLLLHPRTLQDLLDLSMKPNVTVQTAVGRIWRMAAGRYGQGFDDGVLMAFLMVCMVQGWMEDWGNG